jgi:cob(I)alamin adenosyltransferase
MPYRLTKIYTRKGDQGYTHLRDQRISKDDILVEALGTVDELNANIGLISCCSQHNIEIDHHLKQVQQDLFDLGGELHFPDHPAMTKEKVTYLETVLDQWNANLEPLKEFVLPRGNSACVAAHLARTVCRRAERCLVKLHRQIPLNPEILSYINRLSDFLFVLARVFSKEGMQEEVLWEHERSKR